MSCKDLFFQNTPTYRVKKIVYSLKSEACRVDTSPSHWVTHRMEVRKNPLPRAPRHFELRMRGGWVRWASSFGGSHRRRGSLILDWNTVWVLHDYDTEGVTWDCNTAPSETNVFCVIWDKIITFSAIWDRSTERAWLSLQDLLLFFFVTKYTFVLSSASPVLHRHFVFFLFFSGYCARHL